jgi:hypothetical protein
VRIRDKLELAELGHSKVQKTPTAEAERSVDERSSDEEAILANPVDVAIGISSDPRTDASSVTLEEEEEQLVAEVKGIYAGLSMVERKCIQVIKQQADLARDAPPGQLAMFNNKQWQALLALFRKLLHQHHDFFLATQHPSATLALRRLPIKYAMPARLWRHGIHSFLELLRNRLPGSLDHMLEFIYLAYNMMTLLYETVPAFLDTWIECLGDIGRYRMAIEDDDICNKEVWTQVARQWYLKASNRSPTTGRLYHHLAILARPNALQELFYYSKALSVPEPFSVARESILTLLEPFLNGKRTWRNPMGTAYVKLHAILFKQNTREGFSANLAKFFTLLDSHIGRVTQKYLEQGYYIAISNCLALLGYGDPENVLLKILAISKESTEFSDTHMSKPTVSRAATFEGARQLFVQTVDINLQRVGDPNILSFLHITLIFMFHLTHAPKALAFLENEFPWKSLVTMLNALLRFHYHYSHLESAEPPEPEKKDFRPSPEEFAVRGLFWTVHYFKEDFFENRNIEDENTYKEDASMNTEYRPERILWLGYQLAKPGAQISYSHANHKFFVADAR